MRDNRKRKSYFEDFIEKKHESLEKRKSKLKLGLIKENRILAVKQAMANTYLQIIKAKFSLGQKPSELKEDLENCIFLINESHIENYGKVHITGTNFFNQYNIYNYQEILQVLSLAYLLNVSNDNFQILVNLIDRDKIVDNLYEIIIKSRFSDRNQEIFEEYNKDKSIILKAYNELRKAIETVDSIQSSLVIKRFLEKDFYHKYMSLYGSHKSQANTYCGYWSFEAAAVVKIMGIDDSNFRDNQYYPKDLIS